VSSRVTARDCSSSEISSRCVVDAKLVNPTYLPDSLRLVADVNSRRRLLSASSSTLLVSSTRRSTLGDRAFPVTAARAWNSLLSAVRDAATLSTFRQHLKEYTHLKTCVPNSTTRTPATDMLYNTNNGQAHNNLPHRNARAQHLDVLGCGKFLSIGREFVVQQVVELSAGGVVQHVRSWCSCGGVHYLFRNSFD